MIYALLLIGFVASAQTIAPALSTKKPAPAPARWMSLIGEYGPDNDKLYVLEKSGNLAIRTVPGTESALVEAGPTSFKTPDGEPVEFTATSVRIGDAVYPRRPDPAEPGVQFRITPLRPIDELRRLATASRPPSEYGSFSKPDLVELTRLDPGIHLDMRYASSNNFMGTPFYAQGRAFLQRPAALALVHVNRWLKPYGYGLLIHDAYRPWSVTKMFWEATPPDKRNFVADPALGSKHNRGCAVDLTLYELRTGAAVQMPGGYDEMSDRSYPAYPGGTSLQRWHRDLLRRAMEREGFAVFEYEWWHFDHKEWPNYGILNIPFEDLK